MDPVIITAALVGGELSKKDTSYLPVTPDEIAAESVAVIREGASILHLHARAADGTPKHDKDLFEALSKKIIAGCQKEKLPKPILQFSTGGSIGMSLKERLAPLALNPEMATLTLGTVNFGEEVFENSLPTIRAIAAELAKRKIGVEMEIFDAGMMDTAARLIKDGILQKPLHFNFVLGVPGALGGEVENLHWLVKKLPAGAWWSIAGIGRHQLPLHEAAITLGGHLRIGLEDNIYLVKGELAKGNAPFVTRLCALAKAGGRKIATPEEARHILKLRDNR